MDGCSTFGIVFRIIFPIAKPGIFTGAIMAFLAVYNELVFANTLLTSKAMKTNLRPSSGASGGAFYQLRSHVRCYCIVHCAHTHHLPAVPGKD